MTVDRTHVLATPGMGSHGADVDTLLTPLTARPPARKSCPRR